MKVIKETKSLCPRCLKVIDASVFEKKMAYGCIKNVMNMGNLKDL